MFTVQHQPIIADNLTFIHDHTSHALLLCHLARAAELINEGAGTSAGHILEHVLNVADTTIPAERMLFARAAALLEQIYPDEVYTTR